MSIIRNFSIRNFFTESRSSRILLYYHTLIIILASFLDFYFIHGFIELFEFDITLLSVNLNEWRHF